MSYFRTQASWHSEPPTGRIPGGGDGSPVLGGARQSEEGVGAGGGKLRRKDEILSSFLMSLFLASSSSIVQFGSDNIQSSLLYNPLSPGLS